jgi:hypothetical protein
MSSYVRWAVVLIFLVAPGLTRAEVHITAKERVRNRPPGRCGWCVLETLARHQKIKALYGLTRKHPCTAEPVDLRKALKKAHVRYRIQYPGKRRSAILRRAIRQGHGAAVGFRPIYLGRQSHVVALVDYGSRQVRIIDPNDKKFRVRSMSRKRFRHYWDGFAIVLEKKPPAHAKRVAEKR